MANVGDVLVGVKANTSQAETAFRRLQEQFAATRGQLAGAQSRLDAVSTAMAGTTKQTLAMRVAALGGARGIGTVRSSLASLAAMSIGVRGTLGTLSSALLFMSVGNLTAIGVIGGIMLLVKGFQLLTAKAREQREELTKLIAKYKELADKRFIRPEQTFENDANKLRAERARLLERAAERRARLGGVVGAQLGFTREEAQRLSDINAGLRAINGELEDIRRQDWKSWWDVFHKGAGQAIDAAAKNSQKLRDELRELKDKELAEWNHAMQEMEQAWFNIALGQRQARLELIRQAEAVRDTLNPTRELAREWERLTDLVRGGFLQQSEAEAAIRRQWAELLGDAVPVREAQEQFQELGRTAAETFTRSFIRTFMDGKMDFGSLFKNLLATIIEEAILSAIRGALNKSSKGTGLNLGPFGELLGTVIPILHEGGMVRGAPGSNVPAVLQEGETVIPRGGINLSVTMPAANNPLAVARDAQWQAALRESIMVARQQGFRV